MPIEFLFLLLAVLSIGSTSVFAQSTGAPAGETRKTVEGGILNDRASNLVQPAYPAAGKAVRVEGEVNVEVTVDENGNVVSARAVSGHPLLRASSVQAARASKFKPMTIAGQTVKVTGVVVYKFTLPKEAAVQAEGDQLIAMGMVMFLSALKDIPGDEESDQILIDLGKDLPASMKAEKSQFERLVGAKTQIDKARIIDEIISTMRRDLKGTDAWMLDLGAQWGGAIGEAFKITGSEYQRDRENFIKNLQGMNWLLEAPPKGISEASLNKIRAVASYNNETDSITPQFINEFFKSSLDFIDYIVGETKK